MRALGNKTDWAPSKPDTLQCTHNYNYMTDNTIYFWHKLGDLSGDKTALC